jgi:hypothetical protein
LGGVTSAVALDSLTIWTVDSTGLIHHTTDGGIVWDVDTLDELVDEIFADVFGHCFTLGDGRLFRYSPTGTGISFPGQLPGSFSLGQNYPNPFNPVTTIHYSIPSRTLVRLKVIDVLGREVEALVDEAKEAGRHSATWDAAAVSSGVYFYRLELDGAVVHTRKMVLVH